MRHSHPALCLPPPPHTLRTNLGLPCRRLTCRLRNRRDIEPYRAGRERRLAAEAAAEEEAKVRAAEREELLALREKLAQLQGKL